MKQTHYVYDTNYMINTVSISNHINHPFRCIYTIFSEEQKESRVSLVTSNNDKDTIEKVSYLGLKDMFFPPTAAKFCNCPPSTHDIFATTGDRIRLFSVDNNNEIHRLTALSNEITRNPSCGLDWSYLNSERLCSWNLWNLCSLWDVEKQQLIKAFKYPYQIFDLKYNPMDSNIYCFGCEKGFVGIHDSRLENWNVLLNYNEKGNDVIKCSWNKNNENYISVISSNANKVVIIDIRNSKESVNQLTLKDHKVSCIEWAPNSNDMILGTEKGRVLLWHSKSSAQNDKTISESPSYGQVSDLCWSKTNPSWICGAFASSLHYIHL